MFEKMSLFVFVVENLDIVVFAKEKWVHNAGKIGVVHLA